MFRLLSIALASAVIATSAIAEAGEENESYPVHLTMKGDSLGVSEERPLAGYSCGHNGAIAGTYRRAPKVP